MNGSVIRPTHWVTSILNIGKKTKNLSLFCLYRLLERKPGDMYRLMHSSDNFIGLRTKIRNGEYWVGEEWLKAWTITKILIQIFLFTICCTQNSFVNVFQFGFDRLWVSSGEFIHIIGDRVLRRPTPRPSREPSPEFRRQHGLMRSRRDTLGLKAWTITKILIQIFLFTICCKQNSFVNVFQFGFDRLWVSSGEFIHIIFQSKVPISVFEPSPEFRRQHGLMRSRRDTLGGISFPKRRTRRIVRFVRTSTAIQVQHGSSSTRGRRHMWTLLRSLRQIQI
jgi:hypothetical protein